MLTPRRRGFSCRRGYYEGKAHVPAEPAPSPENARISRAHEHAQGPLGSEASPRQGAEAFDRQRRIGCPVVRRPIGAKGWGPIRAIAGSGAGHNTSTYTSTACASEVGTARSSFLSTRPASHGSELQQPGRSAAPCDGIGPNGWFESSFATTASTLASISSSCRSENFWIRDWLRSKSITGIALRAGPDNHADMSIPVRAALLLIRGYKILLSPLSRGECRFLPSCSDYSAEAFARHGFLRGAVLTMRRLGRCHPLCEAGYDPVPEAPGLVGCPEVGGARADS
jgi:uncharacterized protein